MEEKSAPLKSPIHSALLAKALNRFRSELKDDYDPVVDVASMEDVLSQTRATQPKSSRSGGYTISFNRLEPILSHINTFAAVIAVASGADAKATGLVWGSLKVILMLATSTGEGFNDILDMLDKMSLSLPRFHSYEENLPMSSELESALLEVYTEMICFCARAINFYRCHPHRSLMRSDWPKLDGDFKSTMQRIERLSKAVDVEADALRLKLDSDRNAELLAAMSLMKDKAVKESFLPCYHVPLGLNEAFYGREELLRQVKEVLDPKEGEFCARSLALSGMGGVGKTQVARHYANASREFYDAIFWVSADNQVKMGQDMLEIGMKLGLIVDDGQTKDPVTTMLKVKSWLLQTKCRWLLIFDNADDLSILKLAWPGNATGSICITSRDATAGSEVASSTIHIEPFSKDIGADIFLRLLSRPAAYEDHELATDICHTLGGLPLALRQISNFIIKQKLSLKEFLPLYERNTAKIHSRKVNLTDYEYTLATCWELAFQNISDYALALQQVIALLDPDNIPEYLLTNEDAPVGERFSFLQDEMDFMDAKEELLKCALVDRSPDTACLSTHRLIQAAVINKMTEQERTQVFDHVSKVLFGHFPDSWRSGPGYVYGSWDKCETCLPHVQALNARKEKYRIQVSDPLQYTDLLFRCSWYLYESERFDQAQSFLATVLSTLPDKDGLTYARAINLLGLTHLDTNRPHKALACFQATLVIRQTLLDADDAFIASSLSNVSLAYTELNLLDKAVDFQNKAIDIRTRTGSDLIGNSYSNMASCLLRLGKVDEAEEILLRCPSVQNMTDESFLRTDNLRFTSDMVLLSRIRMGQGRSDEAIRLSSKALEFRQKSQGNRYKTCAGFIQVARLLQYRGEGVSAFMESGWLNRDRNMLDRCVGIAETLPDSAGYLALAHFNISKVYDSLADEAREKAHRDIAEEYRRKVQRESDDVMHDDDVDPYGKMVPWMLW